ncbi:acyl-CoA dehydrogenase family protein [Hydrogenophaga sp. 5NK40-0174]|uniref:acyl-CoA dehydrogenase family protein n=1 Tax=Hydrogenophaga sp. 5NK40-0174 TaxID=3127649 RepID=UPI003106935A
MNFEHTEDRRMLADTLDRFLSEQNPIEARHEAAASSQGYSERVWSGLAEVGAIGALFPEDAGGFGGDGFDVSVVFESLGKGLSIEPFLGALVVGRAVLAAGTDAQKEGLEGIMDGSVIATLAHDEAGGHYELAHVATTAKADGDGYVLNGRKAVVLFAEQAGQMLVSARTSGDVDDEAGISLFLVATDAAGVNVTGYGRVDGGRAAEVELKGVKVGAGALLGQAGEGHGVLELAVGWGILALCAEAVGAMGVAKEHTLEYLRTRKQFGVPIGSFQALQHRMADVLLEIEQARSAVINAAAAMGEDRTSRERALSAAKFSIGRIGTLVAEECIQLHGGIGMTWELPMAHYAKRLVMIDHQLGDEDHHLARYIALGQVT